MSSSNKPTIDSFEAFCAYYEKGHSEKEYLWREISFALKERQRLREKDRKLREKKRKVREALPPDQRKKPGRPRKNPIVLPPVQINNESS